MRLPTRTEYIKIWHIFLTFVFIYSIYHLLRDVLQDILNIHNPFTEFLYHRISYKTYPVFLQWITFGSWGKWSTFPIELFLIFSIPIALKKQSVTMLDKIILIVIVIPVLIWAAIPVLA